MSEHLPDDANLSCAASQSFTQKEGFSMVYPSTSPASRPVNFRNSDARAAPVAEKTAPASFVRERKEAGRKDGMLGPIDDIARQTLNSGREFGNFGAHWVGRNVLPSGRLRDFALLAGGGAVLGSMIAMPLAALPGYNSLGNQVVQGFAGGGLGGAVGWSLGLTANDIRNLAGFGRNAMPAVQGPPAAPIAG